MKPRIISVLFLCLFLSACATVKDNHLEISAHKHFDKIDTYIIIPQENIEAEINHSNTTAAAGGGALFALIDIAIDSSRHNNADNLIQPIRNNLQNFDYDQSIKNEISNNLAKLDWFSLGQINLKRSVSESFYETTLASSTASAVLFITSNYRFTPNFDSIYNTATVIMFPNIDELNQYKQETDKNPSVIDEEDNIFRKTIVVATDLHVIGSKELNAMRLANNNSNAVKQALIKSTKKLAKQIVKELASQKHS